MNPIRSPWRAIRGLLLPEGLVVASLLLLTRYPGLFARVEPFTILMAMAVAATGLVVGWRFTRGRVIHGLAILAAAAFAPLLPDSSAAGQLAFLLIPLNLAALALVPDRGILTPGGLLRGGALAVQAIAVVLLHRLPTSHPDLVDWLPAELALPAATHLAAFALALGALLLVALLRDDAPARGLFWATAVLLAGTLGIPADPLFLATTAALALILSALEDAHGFAYRDALTGLPSRRALDELLERTARRYTLAMVDVDHFKSVNDRHGHDVGDQVLRMVAARLAQTRGGARAFRYGGEEFALVFRGRSLTQVKPVLDDLRERVATSEFVLRGPGRPKKKPRQILPVRTPRKKLSVTISLGAAERTARQSPAEMLKTADAALYRAKQAGRNRVVA